MRLRTCVTKDGHFRYGLHSPSFTVHNLRERDVKLPLGRFEDGSVHDNEVNFPHSHVEAAQAAPIYEVPNPFPFKGTTYITKSWADEKAANPSAISLPPKAPFSFKTLLKEFSSQTKLPEGTMEELFDHLPSPMLVTIAAASTDPDDLVRLARMCCDFHTDTVSGQPIGLIYRKTDSGRIRAVIRHHEVFETLANNPCLPDAYKEVMVLRPGVQGGNAIVGDYEDKTDTTHIYEYLRQNSYIPWGHYAANMAHDAVRYAIQDLSRKDMKGLRHLCYQRTFIRLAALLNLPVPEKRAMVEPDELESLRMAILKAMAHGKEPKPPFNASLWGWNFGFDYAPTGYRLHASHQQIHQQFALIPRHTQCLTTSPHEPKEPFTPYGCGDMVAEFVTAYRRETGHSFFDDYLQAIRTNTRMDGNPNGEKSLIVHEDEHAMVFVPKAQTSQWELQIMAKNNVGNILEADTAVRASIDKAMHITMTVLTSLGARMITCLEYPKRFDEKSTDQHLLYVFLPRLPESPGAFSEAQNRWINGHYPEDFALACRAKLIHE